MMKIWLKIAGNYPVLNQLRNSATGATAVEYGLLAGLVALGIAGGLGALADLVNAVFEMIGESTTEVADNLNAEE